VKSHLPTLLSSYILNNFKTSNNISNVDITIAVFSGRPDFPG
jgi:hypothetical protein